MNDSFVLNLNMRQLITWVLCLMSTAALAHESVDVQGWLHPLMGIDHTLAMIAVGAWSAQIGGRAIWAVPLAFLCCMFLGGLLGFAQWDVPFMESGIALSVIALGFAIGLNTQLSIVMACAAVGVFGIFHGYAHGYEMPLMTDKLAYLFGFLSSTALLHVIGAIGASQLQNSLRGGRYLKQTGFGVALIGGCLMYQAVSA